MHTLLYTSLDLPIEKFLGFVLWITMELIGFWCLTYLASLIPYWLTFGVAENSGRINADVDPETIRRKKIYEQAGVEVVYQKIK